MTERRIKNDANEIARKEQDFCLNHCPHPNAKDCRWIPRQCIEEAERLKSGRVAEYYTNNYPYGELKKAILSRDWSDYSCGEIAKELGTTRDSIKGVISYYKRTQGLIIPHADERKRKRGK